MMAAKSSKEASRKLSLATRKKMADDFYRKNGWKPFPFQNEVLKHASSGKNGLITVPTGFGKTNALLMPIMLDGIDYVTPKTKIFAIWITPLRALTKEINDAASSMSKHFELNWKVASRNGDTTSSERQKQQRKPPQVLITTPESLHLLLAQKKSKSLFQELRYLVVDEWHELLGTKRGVQIELAASRLKVISSDLKIWGISATIGNLDEARQVLFGYSAHFDNSVHITTKRKKKIEIKSIIPDTKEEYSWSGHLGIKMAHKLLPIIERSKTTLIFTNTRSQTEIWYQTLLDINPDLSGLIAMHHGSISRDIRDWVENALHEGTLKAVVCTASLDLGVDFRPVETVIQIGSPKGVARFIQRAGRSGHRPGETSKIYFLPTHSMELIEAAALREAVEKQKIEGRQIYIRSFDVLAQYLVTLAVSDGFRPEEVLQEIKTTHCYASISDREWSWLLTYITLGGEALEAYGEFEKVQVSPDGLFVVDNRRIAMRHRLSIGTIVSGTSLQVKFMSGGRLGTIEEYFIAKLQPGETFWFAGRNLDLVHVKENTVYVRKSKSKKAGRVPSWQGSRMPLSSMLGDGLRQQLTAINDDTFSSMERRGVSYLIEKQKKVSIVPKDNQLLIEYFKTREGYHLLIYPFEGRFVHEGMGALLAYRISLLQPITFSIAINDYGFELLSDQPIPVQSMLDNDFLSAHDLTNDLAKSVNATEMARRQFRDIASISGLVFQGYPGKYHKEKHLQASSQLFFDVFRQYDPDNLFLQQAYEEAYQHQMEESRLRQAFARIEKMEIIITEPQKPTPFAFPIVVDRLRSKLSSEKLEDRIKKMQLQLTK